MRKKITRREAIKLGLAGTSGLFLPGKLTSSPNIAKAKSVIQIWMWGGPSHLDTFDPKPEAGYDYCGPYNKPISTNVNGIRIGQMLPLLAQQADKYSIIRSMTHGVFAHETASYITQTGWKPGDGMVHPCTGAVVSYYKGYRAGYKGLLPPYIVVTSPQGRFSEAGFLGSEYKPFATGGDPNKNPFTVEGIVAPGISHNRQKKRRQLLNNLDTFANKMEGNPNIDNARLSEKQAYELILGDAGKVFDLTLEKDKLREKYGKSTFGQSCLLARRLVEVGVPYITINYKGWDSHKQHFPTMRKQLPDLDKGFSTLLQDLSDRGLLDNTIVWWSGEFGRTPKIKWDAPWNGGRGHYGKVFSSVVAGGGFEPGQIVGSSDKTGSEVKDRPVYPGDLIGSMYKLLGINPKANLYHPHGHEVPVIPPSESDGLLNEIM